MVERDLKAIVKRVIQFTRKMNVGRDFWRKTRKRYSAEDKIRIVLSGLGGS